MTDNEKHFMIGLARLTKETGVAIWACGCCDSPQLMIPTAKQTAYRFGYEGGDGNGVNSIQIVDPNGNNGKAGFIATANGITELG